MHIVRPELRGYIVLYDVLSLPLADSRTGEKCYHVFRSGCFRDVLAGGGARVPMLIRHDPSRLVCVGMELVDDDFGLAFCARVIQRQGNRQLLADLKAGKYPYISPHANYEFHTRHIDGKRIRDIVHVSQLNEISFTYRPQFPNTIVVWHSDGIPTGRNYGTSQQSTTRIGQPEICGCV